MNKNLHSLGVSIRHTEHGWQWNVSTMDGSLGNGVCSMPGEAVKQAATKMAQWATEAKRKEK